MRDMNYEETLQYIHKVSWSGSRPGLERIRELLRLAGEPQDGLKFVHVAGTNGKGSTCAMLSSVLCEAGYRTGLFISPFVNRFNERIQLNNEPIADEELARITTMLRPIAEGMEDPPTEFEMITAVAFMYYKLKACDIVVLEVGLGGERDSTNIISTPEAAVITAMGFDHTKQLGGSMNEIAKAKAGIIKRGGDVVIYGENTDAEAVFESAAQTHGGRLHKPDFSALRLTRYDLDGQTFDYGSHIGLRIPLIGAYQLKNAAVAIKTAEVLVEKGWNIDEGAIKRGLARAFWPARFEVVGRRPIVIVDGGHNPHGVNATAESLRRYFPGKPVTFVIGVMADKDIKGMLPPILPLASEFIAVRPDFYRAMPAKELAGLIQAAGAPAVAADSAEEGVKLAVRKAGPDGVVCALGSLNRSGDIRRSFGAE